MVQAFGWRVMAEADRAGKSLQVAELPWLAGPADELQQTLCQKIQQRMVSGVTTPHFAGGWLAA